MEAHNHKSALFLFRFLEYTVLLYKNLFYKSVEAEIWPKI